MLSIYSSLPVHNPVGTEVPNFFSITEGFRGNDRADLHPINVVK